MGWRLAFTNYGGAAGPPGPPGAVGPPGGAGATTPLINANAGALVVCTPVYSSSSGHVDKAQGTTLAHATCTGLVGDNAGIASGATGGIVNSGPMTKTTAQWDAVTGDVGGLVAGTEYWVSAATAGKLVKVAPGTAGNFDTRVGVALSTTILDVNIESPIGPV